MPARTDPDRGWKGAFGAEAESSTPAGPEQRRASYEAINDAYRVIDDYMRQGQRVAEQFWQPSMSAQGGGGDLPRMLERFMRATGEMGMAWLEMVNQWTSAPASVAAARGGAGPFGAGKTVQPGHPGGRGPAGRNGPAQGSGVSVRVESTRQFQISVDLFDPADPGDFELSELVAADRALPPIRELHLERDPSSRRVTLTVRVPDAQPSGVYNAMLLEAGTDRPRGTVSLSLA